MKTFAFAILGAILGLPLSYYLQPEIIQAKFTLSDYLTQLPDLLSEGGSEVVGPVVLGVVLGAVAMGVVGFLLEQGDRKTQDSTSKESR